MLKCYWLAVLHTCISDSCDFFPVSVSIFGGCGRSELDWEDKDGDHCRFLIGNLIHRLKTLPSVRFWARDVDVQDSKAAVPRPFLPEMRGKKQEAHRVSAADLCDKATLEHVRKIAIAPGKTLPNL